MSAFPETVHWSVTLCLQYVGLYEEEEFGGMLGTLQSLISADPDFGESTVSLLVNILWLEASCLKFAWDKDVKLTDEGC